MQLTMPASAAVRYISCDNLQAALRDQDNVLVLDCRSNDEYRQGHISGSHNIVLPQLMMRRLKANKLSLKSLVPPNFRQGKETFLQKCTTYRVVLYDHGTCEVAGDSVTMLSLLHNRMRQEGCSVTILKGGYSRFNLEHAEHCVKPGSVLSSDADDEGCGSSDESGASSPRNGRCSPVASPLRGLAPPVLGLGALRITCGNGAADESDEGDANSGARRKRACSDNCRRRCGDRFNSEGESDEPCSAESVSSNDSSTFRRARCCTCPPSAVGGDSGVPSPYPGYHAGYASAPAPAEILPGLFLGCAKDASSGDVLARHNITYILNVTPNLPNVFEADPTYKYKQIPITDHWSQNLSQFFPEAIAFIDEARSNGCGVLVHCLAGISRSVTLTVAYLMQKRSWSLNDAYDFVKQRKSNVSPNFNFMGQLLDFEKTLGLGDDENLGQPLRDDDDVVAVSESTSSSDSNPSCATSRSSSPPMLFFTTPTTQARTRATCAAVKTTFTLPASLA